MSLTQPIHVLARAVICDEGHLLLCKTVGLEPPFYFLPGGHVEHGESVEAALLRELHEETGADCLITRFLGVLEHKFTADNDRICHDHEMNFIFEVTSATLKRNQPLLRLEAHIQLQWLPLVEIEHIDLRPAMLKTLFKEWLELDVNKAFRSQMQWSK